MLRRPNLCVVLLLTVGAEIRRAIAFSRALDWMPVAAARLAPNDFVRVSRALEVYELTGRALREWHEGHGFKVTRTIAIPRPTMSRACSC